MLAVLEDLEDYDVLFFMPHNVDDTQVTISAKDYVDPGQKIGGSEMGPEWHILLFRSHEPEKVDVFDAILSDPREYVSTLIKQDWYGIVAKKTTTSKNFINDMFDKIKNA